jgi:DNA-binding transcriptional LysR family regulator
MVMPGEGTNSRVRVESVFAGAGLAGRLNVVLGASAFDVLAGYVRGGFGVSITSVSPMILAAAGRPRSPYAGLVFRDATDLFGEERVVILRRRNRLEPPHHRAFRELVAELAK